MEKSKHCSEYHCLHCSLSVVFNYTSYHNHIPLIKYKFLAELLNVKTHDNRALGVQPPFCCRPLFNLIYCFTEVNKRVGSFIFIAAMPLTQINIVLLPFPAVLQPHCSLEG